MTTGAIVALSVGMLLFGLGGVFFLMWFFFRKVKHEDNAARQWQENMMLKIDEVFPTIERLLQEGVGIPTPISNSESEAETCARHQSEDDAAQQREMEEDNNISEAERVAEVGPKTLFGDGGGFVN
ncbi:MAG: hypothetical protein LBT94_05250 [Prevotellaceae bacterium]|nr:hypothetical protein [Prevotellaceae bacterium]